jgi:hypothetical protein
MPLSGPVFSSLLMSQFAAQGFTGAKLLQMSNAIGNGVSNYILSSAYYQGVSTGVGPGVGIGTGTIKGIESPIATSNIQVAMLSQGFTGTKTFQLSSAIGNAFSSFIYTGIVNSSSAGVAVGNGVGKLLGVVGQVMSLSILNMFYSVGFTGSKILQLSNAIGNGICNTILSVGIVTTVIVGGCFPVVPMTGVDIGKII